uniref:Uncharacterized protein LOC116955881 n=1 Tax=Petromyzon marinus TaxID=7757 RepID=A0AAJ7UAY4_PETMA|nr:uncharacterized protein LOC116955881 [Petromyzon marinus]XP_032833111.1 uncharacterized protein LOC116955881 [Petromyzon marinus]XP_032833119.1 uncharacterized protein LOC116955881 [Petromyzon marinus]XP_032833129.1 uncharacterized protein LOC116955881 [Petromyzon marinus]
MAHYDEVDKKFRDAAGKTRASVEKVCTLTDQIYYDLKSLMKYMHVSQGSLCIELLPEVHAFSLKCQDAKNSAEFLKGSMEITFQHLFQVRKITLKHTFEMSVNEFRSEVADILASLGDIINKHDQVIKYISERICEVGKLASENKKITTHGRLAIMSADASGQAGHRKTGIQGTQSGEYIAGSQGSDGKQGKINGGKRNKTEICGAGVKDDKLSEGTSNQKVTAVKSDSSVFARVKSFGNNFFQNNNENKHNSTKHPGYAMPENNEVVISTQDKELMLKFEEFVKHLHKNKTSLQQVKWDVDDLNTFVNGIDKMTNAEVTPPITITDTRESNHSKDQNI